MTHICEVPFGQSDSEGVNTDRAMHDAIAVIHSHQVEQLFL